MRGSTYLSTIPGLSLGPGFQVEWSGKSISVIERCVPISCSTYTAALLISLDAIRVDKIIPQILVDLPSIGVADNVDDLGRFVAWMSCKLALLAVSNW